MFLYISYLIPVDQSLLNDIANRNFLVGGGKSGQESNRSNRDDRNVKSNTISSERKKKSTWHC